LRQQKYVIIIKYAKLNVSFFGNGFYNAIPPDKELDINENC